ncbi:MAG: hypothetical protein J6U63_02445, partial [Clostridia bacterium]|nr:hypothetical protein [Clostridia bacterium]
KASNLNISRPNRPDLPVKREFCAAFALPHDSGQFIKEQNRADARLFDSAQERWYNLTIQTFFACALTFPDKEMAK